MNIEDKKQPDTLMVFENSQVYDILKPIIKIGRSQDNDIILKDPHVSRNHAEVRSENGYYEIIDLGSTGGIRVNGNQVSRSMLKRGDVIELADVILIFGHEVYYNPKTASGYKQPEVKNQAARMTKNLQDQNQEKK